MADVFLSYASSDRAIAERIAHAIQQAGLSVWWDRHIKGGSEFTRDIEEQLESAAHVLVLWSKEAVNSRWVRDEASVAADTHRIVAASIDGTPAPLGFRQFQTIDLKQFSVRGGTLPPELAEALDVDPPSPAPVPMPARSSRRWRSPLVLVAVAAALLLAAGTWWASRSGGLGSLFSTEQKSISLVVMPFDVSGRKDLAYLSSGLAGALSNGLAQLDGLRIIATSSARAVSEDDLTANQVGEKLNATHLVEGEIVPAGDRLRISVRLVDASTGAQLWAQSYDGVGRDLGRLEFAIARDVAAALKARLGIGDGRVIDRGRVDPRAYETYLKGLERVSTRYDNEARKEAIRQFQLATSIAPDFADAHAGLAYILSLSVPPQINWTKEEIERGTRQAVERALALDPENPLALTAKANIYVNMTGDADKGLALARRVLDRVPDFGPANYVYASNLILAGRTRDALPYIDRAVESDPFNQTQLLARMQAYYALGDYDAVRREALACQNDCERFVDLWIRTMADVGTPQELDRDLPLIHKRIDADFLKSDDAKEMMAALRALVTGKPFTLRPARPDAWGFDTAAVYARAGRLDDAFRIARYTAERSQADMVTSMLTDGRNAFPPEARADPRYHALFNDFPQMKNVERVRRANGVVSGLPVDPSKVDEEKRRLAASRRVGT